MPAWVINVGGLTQIVHHTLHYAAHPRPSDSEFAAGENAYFIPHVDYLFVASPNSLAVDSREQEITKHELEVVHEAPDDVFQHLLANASPKAALHYAESALSLDQMDSDLLESYYSAAVVLEEQSRAKNLLESRLDERPVLVNWHRCYQELHNTAPERSQLLDYYDTLLQKEPENAALLYLRGRLTPTIRDAKVFYVRSRTADPQLSWPWAAMGYVAYTQGDWQACKDNVEQALRRKHKRNDLEFLLLVARLGLGEGTAVEREYQRQIAASTPRDALPTVFLLATAVAARGNSAEAKRVVDQWEDRAPVDERPTEVLEEYRGVLEFAAGDLAAVERRVQQGTASTELKLYWLLATGKPGQAEAAPDLEPVLNDPWKALALSLAYQLADDPDKAETWRQGAADALSRAAFDDAQAVHLLQSETPPTKEEIDEVTIPPAHKSLIMAVLATRFPHQHQLYAAMADHLAVQPGGFTPMVRQVVERSP